MFKNVKCSQIKSYNYRLNMAQSGKEFKHTKEDIKRFAKHSVEKFIKDHLVHSLSFFVDHQKPTVVCGFTLPRLEDNIVEAAKASAAINEVIANESKSDAGKINEPHMVILVLEKLMFIRKDMLKAKKTGTVLDNITKILKDYFDSVDILEKEIKKYKEILMKMSWIQYNSIRSEIKKEVLERDDDEYDLISTSELECFDLVEDEGVIIQAAIVTPYITTPS